MKEASDRIIIPRTQLRLNQHSRREARTPTIRQAPLKKMTLESRDHTGEERVWALIPLEERPTTAHRFVRRAQSNSNENTREMERLRLCSFARQAVHRTQICRLRTKPWPHNCTRKKRAKSSSPLQASEPLHTDLHTC